MRFFNGIRQRLINSGRLRKYLLYAIGEIVLVVIGILIALQVNNWNAYRKDRVKERDYLESLKDDMLSNLEEIRGDIASNENVMRSCDSLLYFANRKTYASVDDSILNAYVHALGNYAKLQLEQGTIEEIMNSGSLLTIRNKEIRGQLVDWNRNFIGIKELEQFARDGQERYFGLINTFLPYYAYKYVEVKLPPEIREIYFHKTDLLNTIADIRFIASMLNLEYERSIMEINNLVSVIENELSSLNK